MDVFISLRQTMVALTAGTFLYAGCGSKNEQSLTDCLIEKNVHLYSAWWCMPCLQQEQTLEKELGEEWGYFKENIVVQCYEESKISLVQQCEDKKIEFFPAWEFPNRNPNWEYGVQSLEKIAKLAGCEYNI